MRALHENGLRSQALNSGILFIFPRRIAWKPLWKSSQLLDVFEAPVKPHRSVCSDPYSANHGSLLQLSRANTKSEQENIFFSFCLFKSRLTLHSLTWLLTSFFKKKKNTNRFFLPTVSKILFKPFFFFSDIVYLFPSSRLMIE